MLESFSIPTSSLDLRLADEKARNWAKQLALPLYLPLDGYLESGKDALTLPRNDVSQMPPTPQAKDPYDTFFAPQTPPVEKDEEWSAS